MCMHSVWYLFLFCRFFNASMKKLCKLRNTLEKVKQNSSENIVAKKKVIRGGLRKEGSDTFECGNMFPSGNSST